MIHSSFDWGKPLAGAALPEGGLLVSCGAADHTLTRHQSRHLAASFVDSGVREDESLGLGFQRGGLSCLGVRSLPAGFCPVVVAPRASGRRTSPRVARTPARTSRAAVPPARAACRRSPTPGCR